MKVNRLACSFLCLLLILGLQGCGQKKDATSAETTSSVTTTKKPVESGKIPDLPNRTGSEKVATTNEAASDLAQLKAGAEKGDDFAQYLLGVSYETGLDVSKDYEEAAKWFRKAAEQGLDAAQWSLGVLYENGEGVPKDYQEAAKWYRKAADQGDDMAQYSLGDMYKNGKGVPKDYTEAVKWYRKAAEQDSRAAQFSLGFMYQEGEGVPKNGVEAIKWYRMAAEQGNLGAECNLAAMYNNGDGVPQDYQEAAKWYRKAANQGVDSAQYNLGVSYFKGEGVPQNDLEAYLWFNLAAAQGDKLAARWRDIAVSHLSREEISEGQRRAAAFVPRKETSGSSSNNFISPENPTATGTGFFITDDGYLITNDHVVKDATKVRLVTSAGFISAKVVKVDAANDLALLKTRGIPQGAKALPVAASRGVRLGGTVATVGFPNIGLQGFAPKFARGEIASLSGAADDARYFQISVPVQPGNSGGALVDEHGNVVGVVSAKLNASAALAASGALPENVNYAVKSSFLLSFLESVPEVSAKLKEPISVERKFDDVVKSAEKAAVLVLVY
jgi:TPR repeat protein